MRASRSPVRTVLSALPGHRYRSIHVHSSLPRGGTGMARIINDVHRPDYETRLERARLMVQNLSRLTVGNDVKVELADQFGALCLGAV